ncbi:hypothetical protein [Micromonospora sp. DH14]|uniref:hypothetical protein n=1 Tax=Micromonospora sp. DH14 TaxID=3040120 RepID=UPI002441E267|nr:hypothetical protein [Micromonospora sp. DH14]MDG9674838.1 hypothetical protein [Micromonospora sp. DH14]
MDASGDEGPRPQGVALIREHGGARTRTVDEHMFTVGQSSMRLQLFTAPSRRPVAIATQTDREGTCLMNRAERFVEAVWQRHCPAEPEPPIFIAQQLLTGKDLGFCHFGFTVAGPFAVASPPRWGPRLTEDELTHLVGGPVDAGRGGGFVAPEALVEPRMRFEVAAVIGLPRPDLHGEPACMPAGTTWSRRLLRQVMPRRRLRNCCWYHSVDWAAASDAAVAALARADSEALERVPSDDPEDARMFAAVAALRAQGLDGRVLKAAETLFCDPIQPDVPGAVVPYINGRHRADAMLDAGVRHTVIGRWSDPGADR